MNNLSLEQLRLKKEHLIFDLEKFMLNKGTSDGALLLITPSQILMTDCFVSAFEDDPFGCHLDVADYMYKAIYGESKLFEGGNPFIWQELVMEDGNVCLQLCRSEDMAISLVCVPEIISENQYNLLVEFNNRVKEIYVNNKNYFDNSPMGFVLYDSDNECDTLNNLDDILLVLKDRIGKVNSRQEVILGNSIDNCNLFFKKVKKMKYF